MCCTCVCVHQHMCFSVSMCVYIARVCVWRERGEECEWWVHIRKNSLGEGNFLSTQSRPPTTPPNTGDYCRGCHATRRAWPHKYHASMKFLLRVIPVLDKFAFTNPPPTAKSNRGISDSGERTRPLGQQLVTGAVVTVSPGARALEGGTLAAAGRWPAPRRRHPADGRASLPGRPWARPWAGSGGDAASPPPRPPVTSGSPSSTGGGCRAPGPERGLTDRRGDPSVGDLLSGF